MPIVLRHSEALELNLVEYQGAVTMAELDVFAEYNARHLDSMSRDSLNIVMPGASFTDVDFPALDALFARYHKLYAPLRFQIMRRSAWLCLSAAAAAHVRHWLSGDARENMSSAVRQFDNFLKAGEWLVLSPSEIADIERGEGFAEIVRFDASIRSR